MKQVTALALAASFIIAPAAYAGTASKSADNFVEKASVAGKFEIDSSKLALEKSKNADVREFAQQMIDDHTKASEKLKATLPAAGVDASAAKDTLDSKHQKIMNELKSASGDAFDKKYIAAQVDAHDEAVTLFKTYSNKGDDKALQGFASETLPTLEKHKEHVEQLKASK